MAKVNIKDGIIVIDTNTMDDEEKTGVLKVLIELETCTCQMSMVNVESVQGGFKVGSR